MLSRTGEGPQRWHRRLSHARTVGSSGWMDKEGVRQLLLANGCVALFLCVPEDYQLHVTFTVTLAVVTYMVARAQAKQAQD